jgi:hypothetical protein
MAHRFESFELLMINYEIKDDKKNNDKKSPRRYLTQLFRLLIRKNAHYNLSPVQRRNGKKVKNSKDYVYLHAFNQHEKQGN